MVVAKKRLQCRTVNIVEYPLLGEKGAARANPESGPSLSCRHFAFDAKSEMHDRATLTRKVVVLRARVSLNR